MLFLSSFPMCVINIYKGESRDRVVALLYHNQHYTPLKSVASRFGQTYYCVECEVGTNLKSSHKCKSQYDCRRCLSKRCLKLPKLPKYCRVCCGMFSNPECFQDQGDRDHPINYIDLVSVELNLSNVLFECILLFCIAFTFVSPIILSQVSLYPFVCKWKKYPVGHPEIIIGPKLRGRSVEEFEGLVRCTVLPPKHLFSPLLPSKINESFCLRCGERVPHSSRT